MKAPSQPEDSLEENERQLWQQYQQEIAQGKRKTTAPATLQKFIEAVKSYSPLQRKLWVEAICRKHFDHKEEKGHIPHPLFTAIILPELKRGLDQAEIPYARWLAESWQLIIGAYRHNPEETGHYVNIISQRQEDFFEIALQHDPTDKIARQSLIEHLANNFNYYIHEVPHGVLRNPDIFKVELAKFEDLVAPTGELPAWKGALARWKFHCNAWEDYLNHRSAFKSYADYLALNQRKEAGN